MGSTATSIRRLTPKQSQGRVANAVADLLRKKLTVPQIYLRPRLPALVEIDVVAVDHAGSGDFHGVEIKSFQTGHKPSEIASSLSSWIAQLKTLPLHFKYLALPQSVAGLDSVQTAFSGGRAFDPHGIGRVGLIAYPAELLEPDGTPIHDGAASILIKPERFLLRGEKLETMERFVAKAKPDISVRI